MTETKTGSPIEFLKPEEAQAVEEFKERLLAALPDQVRDIILFGSKARSDGHPDSDVDLLVVLENPTKEQSDTVGDIMFDIMFDRGVDLSAITFSHEEATRAQELGTPLMRNVAEEGIIIVGEAIVVGGGRSQRSSGASHRVCRDDRETAAIAVGGIV